MNPPFATVKIRKVGGSAGIIIPKHVLDDLHAAVGDTLHLVKTDRGYELTTFDPELEEALAIYREGAREYRDALGELAR